MPDQEWTMTLGKETVCSLCHGEIGPDIYGRAMCYGCGPEDLKPPEIRKRQVEPEKPRPQPMRPQDLRR